LPHCPVANQQRVSGVNCCIEHCYFDIGIWVLSALLKKRCKTHPIKA
jgi:hypothetical protein